MLVCADQALAADRRGERGAPQAMALESFSRTPPRRRLNVGDFVSHGLLAGFVGFPVSIVAYALCHMSGQPLLYVLLTQLFPLIFAFMLVLAVRSEIVVCREQRREQRRAAGVRRGAFERAVVLATASVETAA